MCYFCGNGFAGKVYRNTECPECGKDLKICLNCKFYEPGAHWDCRETIPEAVRDKERSNFCEFFTYIFRAGAGKELSKSKNARDQFNNLFGDD